MADPDTSISNHIEQLVAEEHRLLDLGGEEQGLTPEQHARLQAVKVELDQLWDLIRQRRALRDAGLNPAGASERPASEVEGYLQ
jgi:hypothetical protein